jgi:hypothetical protein
MRQLAALALLAACGGNRLEAAPSETPAKELAPVDDALCVTKGTATIGATIDVPTLRAIGRNTAGDAAALEFVYRGDSAKARELASGQARRQLGLKLRAQNGCNLVYVMWRLDPKPKLDISVKRNAGARNHEECGANGYIKVKPTKSSPVPALEPGGRHTLRAEIAGDRLTAWIDDRVVWRGALPAAARDLTGPAGIRSDNLAFDLVGFSAPRGDAKQPVPKCHTEDSD